MALADYQANLASARFAPPPPDVLQLMGALHTSQDQADINRFLMARIAMILPESFFNPDTVSGIMSKPRAGPLREDRRAEGILTSSFATNNSVENRR